MYLITLHYQYFIPSFPEMQKLYNWKGIVKAVSSHLSHRGKPEVNEICDSVVWASTLFRLTFHSCVFLGGNEGTEACCGLKEKLNILTQEDSTQIMCVKFLLEQGGEAGVNC